MTDMINHPPHYTSSAAKCECGRQIECIDVTRHMGFNAGNVVKYLWREGLKGSPLADLRKAAWYLADLIRQREAANTLPREGLPFDAVKAERDAARAEGWGWVSSPWPETPEKSPPDGINAASLAQLAARENLRCAGKNEGGSE